MARNDDGPTIANDDASQELEHMLYARHAEIENLKDLGTQRGTPIPALFNQFYRYIQNPSSVSVETYKRMIDTDDTVGSGIDFLTICLAARLGRYTHPSEEISKWVNDRLDEIEGGWFNARKELLGAAWSGFSVQEKVWANTQHGFVPKKLVSLPPGTILFETERTGELTPDGILQYQRNYNPAFIPQGANYLFGFANSTGKPDPFAKYGDFPFPLRTANAYSYLSIRIPTQKCLHYAFDASGKFGNPYGRSLLRRAYKFYVMKDAFLQMLSVALDRKGTPLMIVYADANANVRDADKAPANGQARGMPVGKNSQQAARDAFKNVHNDTTIILPGKKGQVYDTDFVSQSSNANDFISAIQMCDRGIMRALLIPSLVFTAGDGAGSFSLGQEHTKTFDKILDGMLDGVQQTYREQLVKEMLAYNFPKSAWEKDGVGQFGRRELSQEERDKEMDCLEKAVNMGAVDMNDLNDLNEIREKIGFDARDTPIEKPSVFGGFGGGLDENGEPIEPDGDENPFDKGGADGKGPPKPGEQPSPAAGKPPFPPKKGTKLAAAPDNLTDKGFDIFEDEGGNLYFKDGDTYEPIL